jgi:uncharacterized protein (DUF305 family)
VGLLPVGRPAVGSMIRLLLVLAVFAVLCGCGQDSPPVEVQERKEGVEQGAKDREGLKTATSRRPGADSPEAGFARDMSVHHTQAVEMAEIVLERTESAEIRGLAADIARARQAQIARMQGWLDAWDLPPTSTQHAMGWMDRSTEGRMPGMATPEEIDRLKDAPPEEADEQFLWLMIRHHRGAIQIAEAILERTDRPEVRQLTQDIAASQRQEIRLMDSMSRDRLVNFAEVPLEPVEDSGVSGTATFEEVDGGVRVALDVNGLPKPGVMYLAHIHPGPCAGGGDGSNEHGEGGHQGQEGAGHAGSHGGYMETRAPMGEIEAPLTPVEGDAEGRGSSTTVVPDATVDGLFSGEPVRVNVHTPGSGNPPPMACANLGVP